MSQTRRMLTTLLFILALVVAGGCGGGGGAAKPSASVDPNAKEVSPAGDIPDDQVFIAFKGQGFTVKVPEGWSRTTSGSATTFTDKLNSVTVDTAAADAPLTLQKARSAEVPTLARTVKGFADAKVSAVTRNAGTGVRITYLADAPADAVTGKSGRDAVERYVFFHAGRQVTLTLSGPEKADNVDPWKIVSDSLQWTP